MKAWQLATIAGLAAFAAAVPAQAITCYLILDRGDAVVYRDSTPPFDLSDGNSAPRQALRQRGQHLMVVEFDNCRSVGYVTTATGGTIGVDEIVMQLKPAISTAVGKPNVTGTRVSGY